MAFDAKLMRFFPDAQTSRCPRGGISTSGNSQRPRLSSASERPNPPESYGLIAPVIELDPVGAVPVLIFDGQTVGRHDLVDDYLRWKDATSDTDEADSEKKRYFRVVVAIEDHAASLPVSLSRSQYQAGQNTNGRRRYGSTQCLRALEKRHTWAFNHQGAAAPRRSFRRVPSIGWSRRSGRVVSLRPSQRTASCRASNTGG